MNTKFSLLVLIMSPHGKRIWTINRSDFCWLCNGLRIVLLSLAFFASVTRSYNSNNSGMYKYGVAVRRMFLSKVDYTLASFFKRRCVE